MDKQTTIYLSEKDCKRIEKIKEIWEISKTSELIKALIREEFDRVQKYTAV